MSPNAPNKSSSEDDEEELQLPLNHPSDKQLPRRHLLTKIKTKTPRVLADKGCRVVNKEDYLYDEALEEFLHSLPKVELHVHLDGSFDHSILHQHLQEVGPACLPVQTTLPWDGSPFPVRHLVEHTHNAYPKFHSLCTCRGKRSLQEMIKCFQIFVPIVQGDLALLERLAFDFVKRQADQNVRYTEVRYSPHLLATGGSLSVSFAGSQPVVDARSVVDAVTRGLRRGQEQYKVRVNQILCCITWRPDWADDVVEIANERRNDAPCAVVGVDVAAGEEHFDSSAFSHLHEPHVKALQRAKDLGLSITMHAGEVAAGENVLSAINTYHATRIGHGYRIAVALGSNTNDSVLLDELKRRRIHFEVCPTSSVETGGWDYDETREKNWEEHPLVLMMMNGLNVGLNSDDPAVFDTSLTFQYRIAATKMKLSYTDLVQSVRNSIDASFACEDVKEELREQLTLFSKQHEQLLELPN